MSSSGSLPNTGMCSSRPGFLPGETDSCADGERTAGLNQEEQPLVTPLSLVGGERPCPLPSRSMLLILPITLTAAQEPSKLQRNHSRAVFSASNVFELISTYLRSALCSLKHWAAGARRSLGHLGSFWSVMRFIATLSLSPKSSHP